MTAALAGAVLGAVAVGCSDRSPEPGPSTTDTSAQGAPTSTSASATATSTQAESDSAVVDVDPSAYVYEPGQYRFRVTGTPLRECILTDEESTIVFCSVTWPSGTPEVTNGSFTGRPNSIVLLPDGFYPSIDEGGPPGSATLQPGQRISVGTAHCTAVDGGVQCENTADVGFSFVDGNLSTRGHERAPVTHGSPPATPAPSASGGAGGTDGVYTDGIDPVAPGTYCGAATGRAVVQVREGTISCTDALEAMEHYHALPAGKPGEFGNANIRLFDGWSCSSPTAVTSRQEGYGAICHFDAAGIVIVEPL
jgi:hypothetical protein